MQNSKGNSSPEFTMEEMEIVLKELKTGKCIDPLGFVREMFINGGEGTYSVTVTDGNPTEKDEICTSKLK